MSSTRRYLKRLSYGLPMPLGLIGFMIMLPLTRDWGALRWVAAGVYVLIVIAVAAYFMALREARERHHRSRIARACNISSTSPTPRSQLPGASGR